MVWGGSELLSFSPNERRFMLAVRFLEGTDMDRVQVNILTSIDQMSEFSEGEVLVADMTDPDWEPIMPHGAHRAVKPPTHWHGSRAPPVF